MTATAPEILPPEGAFAPMPTAIAFPELGVAAVPHPAGGATSVELRDGLHLAWAPTEEDKVLLALFAGRRAEIGFAVTSSHQGLRELIADLQSIDAQLGEARP